MQLVVAWAVLTPAHAVPIAGAVAQPGRGRPTAPTSDVLTHSALVPCPTSGARRAALPNTWRVATWNISAARYAPVATIAAELSDMRADIVALQEVDFRLRRSGSIDQAGELASALRFHHVFAATIKWDGGDYGLAVLSRWPLVSVERHRLEVVGVGEPRIVLDVTICANGRRLRLFNHHADVGARSRQSSLAALTAMLQGTLGQGVLVAGDFNEDPGAPAVRELLAAGLIDPGAARNDPTSSNGRIDYVLADEWLAKRLRSAFVWRTQSSDHHAMVAEFGR